MGQNTLDTFLVSIPKPGAPDEPCRGSAHQAASQPEKVSVACQAAERATRHHLIRTLTCYGTGLLGSTKRARTELQHLSWASYHQVAGYTTSNGAITGDDDAITSIAIHPASGSMAFLQSGGVLNLYPMHSLISDAMHVRSRANKGQALLQAQPTDDMPALRQQSTAMQNVPSGTYIRRSVGTRTSTNHLPDIRRDQLNKQLSASRNLALLATDNLPSGGSRFNLGHRLEEVVWCPDAPATMALVGASTPQVTMLEVSQGRRQKWSLNIRPDASTSNARLTNLVTPQHGPYTLCASSSQGPYVWLWDVRRSRMAVSQLVTHSKTPLTGSMQVSPDGHLLYALAQGNQLLVWDLRKGSNTSGVLHFGGTGFYHHPLLLQQPLLPALTAAMRNQLAPLLHHKQQQQQAGRAVGGQVVEAGDVSGGVSHWQVVTEPPMAPHPPGVDHLLLDPTNPARVALVMQDCSAAVFHMPSSTITHVCLSPSHYLDTPTGTHPAGNRYHMRRKKGCWAAGGDMLLLPHMYHEPHVTHVTPSEGEWDVEGMVDPQGVQGPGGGQYQPAVAVMDCRQGWFSEEPWAPVNESNSIGIGKRSSSSSGRGSDALFTTAPSTLAGCWLSRHVVDASGQELVVPGSMGQETWSVGQALHWQQKPRHVMPVRSWVTCVSGQTQPFGWLAAGTQDGHLLMLGPT